MAKHLITQVLVTGGKSNLFMNYCNTNSTTAQTTASQLQFPSKYESSFRVDIETDLKGK